MGIEVVPVPVPAVFSGVSDTGGPWVTRAGVPGTPATAVPSGAAGAGPVVPAGRSIDGVLLGGGMVLGKEPGLAGEPPQATQTARQYAQSTAGIRPRINSAID